MLNSPSSHEEDERIFRQGRRNAFPNDAVGSFNTLLRGNLGERYELHCIRLKDGNIVLSHGREFDASVKDIEDLNILEYEELNRKFGLPILPTFNEYITLAYDYGKRIDFQLKASSKDRMEELIESIFTTLKSAIKYPNNLRSEDRIDTSMQEKFLSNIHFFSFGVEYIAQLQSQLSSIGFPKTNYGIALTSTQARSDDQFLSSGAELEFKRILGSKYSNYEKIPWIYKGILYTKEKGYGFLAIHAEPVIDEIQKFGDTKSSILDFANKEGISIAVCATNENEFSLLKKLGYTMITYDKYE